MNFKYLKSLNLTSISGQFFQVNFQTFKNIAAVLLKIERKKCKCNCKQDFQYGVSDYPDIHIFSRSLPVLWMVMVWDKLEIYKLSNYLIQIFFRFS